MLVVVHLPACGGAGVGGGRHAAAHFTGVSGGEERLVLKRLTWKLHTTHMNTGGGEKWEI